MSRDNEKPSYNARFIPAVSGPCQRKGTTGTPLRAILEAKPSLRDPDAGNFMPVTPKDTWGAFEKEIKQGKTAQPDLGKEMTAENYQKLYEQRKREEEVARQEREAVKQNDPEAARREETQNIYALRNEAQTIRQEMVVWENRRGQGSHDDQAIDGQISLLQAKLNAIPPEYQY